MKSLWVAMMALAGAAAAAEFELPLSVEEPAGAARQAEPISGGVPLPQGRFAKDQPFALFRADGAEVPCQVSPLVVETDGTLRWVLLDFQDDVAAGATSRYLLRAARPSARPDPALAVEEDADAVRVDTGAVSFTVSKREPFGLFREVRAGGEPVVTGGEASYVQLQGRKGWDDDSEWRERRLVAGPPDSVALWHAGPLRVTVEVRGRFADDPLGAGYQAWITAWAGHSRVHVKYALCNSNPDQFTLIPVGRATVRLRLARPAGEALLGASEPMAVDGDAWLHQGLYLHHTWQDIPGAVKAGRGDETLWTGNGPQDRPQGWLAAGGAFVCDRFFAADPARRLAREDGALVLEPVAPRFVGPKDQKFKRDRRVGEPWKSEGYWLFDCTHRSSEYLMDFAPPAEPAALAALVAARRSRLWVRAPAEAYSRCQALATGHFGTLEDEKACYRKWGWSFEPDQVPSDPEPHPDAFVAWEDNHYESEADSVQGLLMMYLRTGQRGWLDRGAAWARYHMDLQTWRTDGWAWKDGAIWFPQGGPQGTRRERKDPNFAWGPSWGKRKDSPDCADLWRQARGKSCYCHFYGSGLADYYCLTGEPDALGAAVDNVEVKDSEFRKHHKFVPGETPVGSIRGFGRGFEVILRVLQVAPDNETARDLARLCARTLWESPSLDERGFHASRIGGMPRKHLTEKTKEWMAEQGIEILGSRNRIDALKKGDQTWKVHCYGGTWQHIYIQNGADLAARVLGDEDMADFAIAFAHMSARFMLSDKCHQTWYYTYFDVPTRGQVYDPWVFEHTDTTDGIGCVHSGYYTRHYVDACTKGYSRTGESRLLEKAREFWYYGSKRRYRTKELTGGPDEVGMFASHKPPKNDTVLEAARLFYEVAHPREDAQPPQAVADLQVEPLGEGKARVSFTAPADAGGGAVARYQVKAAALPIVPYEQWDCARDQGKKRNWWRAANLEGEPRPSEPGTRESFVVSGLPEGRTLTFAVRSFDEAANRSPISNLATP
ncbi:MAG: hypothetical protein ACLF0G_02515 [Candidatus Brocadiia bacterium]